MRTSFSPEQLAQPHLRAAEKELRSCVHCGICTATCPTYRILGNELDSPRGRIQVIQQMLECDAMPDVEVVQHLDRCLSCNACVSACPSGVNYPRLIDAARYHVERRFSRSMGDRMVRLMLGTVLPRRWLMARMLRLARLASFMRSLMPARMKALVAGAGALPRPMDPGSPSPSASPRERVALHIGCVQEVIAPQVTGATERVLRSLDLEPVRVEGEGCCGALNHHLGQESAASRRALALCRDVASAGMNGPLAGLVTTATGCGAAIRDFGHHLATGEARTASGMTIDVMQFVSARMPASARTISLPVKVAYHFPCSLQHGMRGVEHGPALLRRLGFDVVELRDRACCGSAGTYSVLQPEIAGTLERAKVDEISSISPDVVVSGNIGCMSQMSKSARVAVLHPIELVDWALRGASPEEIRNRLRVEPANAHST